MTCCPRPGSAGCCWTSGITGITPTERCSASGRPGRQHAACPTARVPSRRRGLMNLHAWIRFAFVLVLSGGARVATAAVPPPDVAMESAAREPADPASAAADSGAGPSAAVLDHLRDRTGRHPLRVWLGAGHYDFERVRFDAEGFSFRARERLDEKV